MRRIAAVVAALCALAIGGSAADAQPRRRPPQRNNPRRSPPRVVERTPPEPPPSMDFTEVPEPPPPPPPPEPERPRPVAIDVAAGLSVFNRSFRWEGDTAHRLRPYTLSMAPAVSLAAVWYPGAHVTSGALAHLGLTGSADFAFGMSSRDDAGREFETSALQWSVGVRARIPLGVVTPGVSAEVFNQRFYVAVPTASDDLGVPEAIYRSVALGVDVNFSLRANISVRAGARYLAVLSAGTIGDTVFSNATAAGVDAELGLSLGLGAGFDLRFAGGFRRYFFALHGTPEDRWVATGATDDYFSALAALGFRR